MNRNQLKRKKKNKLKMKTFSKTNTSRFVNFIGWEMGGSFWNLFGKGS